VNDWKKYERFIASLCSVEYQDLDITVIPNARIRGELSETSRQIDVLIDSRFGNDRSRRIIVDAKRYKRPLNVKDDFHLWCWSYGNRFYLTDEDEFKCNCDSPWYWLTAIEEDENLDTNEGLTSSVYLLLCALTNVLIADRKPLK